MGVTGLFGGAFDPPHNGHVALAETALEHFALERLLALVVVDPGHRDVVLDFPTRFGLAAIDAAHDGRWGMMPALHGTRIELVPLADAVAELRTVPLADYEEFSALFG